jgi:hypothetical protein
MALDRAFPVCYTLQVVVDLLCPCSQSAKERPAVAQKEAEQYLLSATRDERH